jgi:hypothetical protein
MDKINLFCFLFSVIASTPVGEKRNAMHSECIFHDHSTKSAITEETGK